MEKLSSNALGGCILFALTTIICGLWWWCGVVKSGGGGVVRSERGVTGRWRRVCCFWRTEVADASGGMSRPNNNNNSTQYELIDSSSEGDSSAYSSRGFVENE